MSTHAKRDEDEERTSVSVIRVAINIGLREEECTGASDEALKGPNTRVWQKENISHMEASTSAFLAGLDSLYSAR